MDKKEFEAALHEYKDDLPKRGLRSGPVYGGDGGNAPALWHDNIFERGIEPSGEVECATALQAGRNANGLNIVLIASHANEEPLVVPAGATVTLKFEQSAKEDGPYEAVGPTICWEAPAGGIKVDPDGLLLEVAAPQREKRLGAAPWLKLKCGFSGSITGGKVDAALAYVPR